MRTQSRRILLIGRFEQIDRRTTLLNARRILSDAGQTRLAQLAIEDITERPRPKRRGRDRPGDAV